MPLVERGVMTQLPISTQVHSLQTPVAILGVPFDPLTIREAVDRIENMIASRKSHYLATANVDFVVQAQSDVELRRILFDAHLVLCDGTPVLWASRLLGRPLPERVAGSDLVPKLIEVAAKKGYRIYLLGATPKAAEQAVENLRLRHPDLLIAGHYSPPFQKLLEMDHTEIARRIRETQPDLLFVSFGCPKQEKWLAMNYRWLEVPVAIGVGATIDFLAGRMKRAPIWMQRTGMEWLFRLVHEPRRLFKRYATDFAIFGWQLFSQWRRLRWAGRKSVKPGTFTITRQEKNWQQIAVAGRLDANTLQTASQISQQILAVDRHCWLELSRVDGMDSVGVGWLVQLQKQLQAKARNMILLSPSQSVRRTLTFMRLQDFFLTAPDFTTAQRMGEHCAHEFAVPVAVRTAAASNPLLWQGEITAVNADRVWIATESYLVALRKRELTIDLSRVRFLDSSGATVMTAVKQLARQLDIRLTFTRPRAAVRNVLRHAGLENLLTTPPRSRRLPGPAPHDLVLSRQT
jgi:N-acetylglucosaminyldiphosphoundecaprenol N-acetyl-beta-D-mannosaminyltransferase